jgi:hypothetical protein
MTAPKDERWKWISHEGRFYYSVGISADGALINPRGYPEDLVRDAIAAAQERARVRRSKAARQAAATRKARQDAKVYEVSKGIVDGNTYGPAASCVCCWKGLDDPESIRRGIGPDCWQRVLKLIHEHQQVQQPGLESA